MPQTKHSAQRNRASLPSRSFFPSLTFFLSIARIIHYPLSFCSFLPLPSFIPSVSVFLDIFSSLSLSFSVSVSVCLSVCLSLSLSPPPPPPPRLLPAVHSGSGSIDAHCLAEQLDAVIYHYCVPRSGRAVKKRNYQGREGMGIRLAHRP